MPQDHFIDRMAARRDIPRCQLEFIDYGRAIRDVESKQVIAHRTHEGWLEVGVTEMERD